MSVFPSYDVPILTTHGKGKSAMKSVIRLFAATSVALALSSALPADAAPEGVTLNAARISAADAAGVAKFYEAAFGLQEIRHFTLPSGLEVVLNFGATPEAAKENPTPQIVISQRANDSTPDPFAHLIFNVTDINATAAAITAAGGKIQQKPRKFGMTSILIALALDPAGNRIEMIQQPRKLKKN
jgi:predicted enzyme related to lactoylglutathione lyase